MTNEQRIKEIAERVEKATPGDWGFTNAYEFESKTHFRRLASDYEAPETTVLKSHDLKDIEGKKEDLEFIAHSRSDIPWLLERAKALEARDLTPQEAKAEMEKRCPDDWDAYVIYTSENIDGCEIRGCSERGMIDARGKTFRECFAKADAALADKGGK